MKLYIKHMVCGRCKRLVREILEEVGVDVQQVELGEVEIGELPSDLKASMPLMLTTRTTTNHEYSNVQSSSSGRNH